MQETELEVGGQRFRARVAGPEDGTLVLLLHGFPQTSWEWRHQIPILADPGFRVVAPDQRGYSPGARPRGVASYRIEALVDDALGFADSQGAERFHLVGHDWGAIVGWHLAVAHAERLRTFTSVSTPHLAAFAEALRDPRSGQALRSAYIPILRRRFATWLATPKRLRLSFERSGLAGHDVEEHVRVLGERDAIDAALHWYRAYDLRAGARLGPVTVPTLYVWSSHDIALGRVAAERTGDHVTGPYRFEVLDDVPHWVPEVAPDALNALLLDHLL